MAKIVLDSRYDFYKLTEYQREKMVGKMFTETNRPSTLYFPVQLAPGEFNYGKQQGLIFVTPILKSFGKKWFRVGASSPDDLDCDLDFQDEHTYLRQEVIEYIRRMMKQNVTYRGVLKEIQDHFKAGEMTS